jgi:hypothetical protein
VVRLVSEEVWKTEEKGSDVNLACYLLLDAFDGDCEAAVIIHTLFAFTNRLRTSSTTER